MNPNPQPSQLSERIQTLLGGLRTRIRVYVWVEGIAVALIWLALTFWVSYAIDYWVLVRGFAVELPWFVRGLMLLATGAVLGWILYRWILRRAFVRLADHSMAVLLERRFGEFHDSLVTSVEMNEHPDHASGFSAEMLSNANNEALANVDRVRLREVFNFVPVVASAVAAIVLLGSVIVFAAASPDTFSLAASRIYLMDRQPWERLAKVELIGIRVQHSAPDGDVPSSTPLQFGEDAVIKVARGSEMILRVRADAGKVVPDKCVVDFWTDDGGSGSIDMEKDGDPVDGYQEYRLDRQPFKGPTVSFDFEVVGKNYGSLSSYRDEDGKPGFSLGLWPVSNIVAGRIEVVDSPIVADASIQYARAAYIDPSRTPRTIEYRSGTRIIRGSDLTIRCLANKPLKSALIHYPTESVTQEIVIGGEGEAAESFSFQPVRPLRFSLLGVPVDMLVPARFDDELKVDITLHDADDIVAESPFSMTISVTPDEPPKVDTFLQGIGSAVTPDVIIPFHGNIVDDHGVAASWIEVVASEMDAFDHELKLPRDGTVATAIDFQKKREEDKDAFTLKPGPDRKLNIVVKATDHFDLGDSPNLGSGQRHELDIVTPDQLMAMLELREGGQRERMQQIYDEMKESLDFLWQVKVMGADDFDAGGEAGDVAPAGGEPGEEGDAADVQSLRLSYARRSLLQTRKSAGEIGGVIATIRHIRDQITNNRIDAVEHQERLEQQIAAPLDKIAKTSFPELQQALEDLEKKVEAMASQLDDPEAAANVDAATVAAIEKNEKLLSDMDQVLRMLLKLEDYNKLLGYFREMIELELELKEKTEKQYKKQALQDLTD